MSERYNGWSNYETWRINLEMFDGLDADELLSSDEVLEDPTQAERDLALRLENMAEEYIELEVPSRSGFTYNLAMSFLAKVDFAEIADHMVTDYIANADYMDYIANRA
mgnify:CR=1 FL=1